MTAVPTVMISWAHGDPGWDDARAESWANEVLSLAVALRTIGFFTEIDLLHLHERKVDWSRWGPLQVRQLDVVLVVVSQGWRERWEGTNDPRVGVGAAAEADALLGIFHNDGQLAFREKVIVVVLPSMRGKPVIPDRLTGVNRVELDDFSKESLSPLVHLLTESPLYEAPPLGELAPLAPVPPPEPSNSPDDDLEMLDERIRTLRSAVAGLSTVERRARRPTHERISLQIDIQLAELLKERADHLERSVRSRVRRAPAPGAGQAVEPRVWTIPLRVLAVVVAAGLPVGALSAVALPTHAGEQSRHLARASTRAPTSSLATLPDPPRALTLPQLHNQSRPQNTSNSNSSTSRHEAPASSVGLSTTTETPISHQETSSSKESTRSKQTSGKHEGGGTKESGGGA